LEQHACQPLRHRLQKIRTVAVLQRSKAMLQRLGGFIYGHPKQTVVATGLFVVLSVVVLLRGGHLAAGDIEGLEAEVADEHAATVLGATTDNTVVAIFRHADLTANNAAALATIDRALQPLRGDPRVRSVITPTTAQPVLGDRMVNSTKHSAYALITLAGTLEEARAAYPAVRSAIASEGMRVTMTGRIPLLQGVDRTLERDLVRAELVALPLALLVLLLVFRSVVAAVLPIVVGGLAVLGGIAVIIALSHVMEIASYAINVASLIGLGVAIDYSLFIISRYREGLAAGASYRDALVRAMATSGRVVVFSGLAVASGLGGLMFFPGSYLLTMGIGGAVVIALAVLFALTLLPALLALLGPKIDLGRLRIRSPRAARGAFRRITTTVTAHPWRVLVPTLAFLLLIGVPFFYLRLGGIDARVLGMEAEARRGYELLRRDFPDQARTRIMIAVQFPSAPALDLERIGALYDLSRRVGALPGIAQVESIVDGGPHSREAYQYYLLNPPAPYAALVETAKQLTVGDRVVLLYAVTDVAPQSDAARELVHEIRSNRQVGDGELVVGGQTALDIDSTEFLTSRVPYAIAFVVSATLIVLFLMFGSVVLPIKAVLMNVVSIAGSFGALVWAFQEGHVFGLDARPIDPSVPILLFCILFGLSMDYEVLLLSRIQEAYRKHHDNTRAVLEGLDSSARLITSAAAIMVTVFGAFSLAEFVVIREVGFGMALGVALDATLVRVLLVPSTMVLLGDWNWWSPRELLRLRRRIHLGVEAGRP
jgi:RND superfamily putative drug exporter